MLTFGSLFAGIGGFDLGLEWAGMRCAWQVEIDPFCQKVLAKHWPDVERFSDVRECGKHNLKPVDVICGGVPCQPFSVAGKRRGAADDRNLWPEAIRVVKELRPHWIVFENVAGIRTVILDQVLSDLERMEYSSGTAYLSAGAIGAGHRRLRAFIIANSGGERLENIAQMGPEAWAINGMGREHTSVDSLPDLRGFLVYRSPEARFRVRLSGFGGVRRSRLESIRDSTAWYETESGICGVAHGVPARVDRLRALGNAVVPQCAELIGRLIVEASHD